MELTNKPHKSKINAFNIVSTVIAIFALPQLESVGITPQIAMLVTGIGNVILRTFFNGKKE